MSKPFIAARVEDKLNQRIERVVRDRGWSERVTAYTGYGSSKFIRVLARLLLSPEAEETTVTSVPGDPMNRRGWRNFFTASVMHGRATVHINGESYPVVADRNGYVDCRLPVRGLEPGWHTAELVTEGEGASASARILIVDPDQEFGLVSDIDDTVITTSLPRPLLAAWNTFVLHESARQAVDGMADLYAQLMAEHPDAPVIYVSTGAWNTAPTLTRFLRHHGFPDGPMLLTDWGPTNSGWFRSGQEHKRTALRDLAIDFPKIRWILIGDDGQHDPSLYGEFAESHPDRAQVIGLRQLTPGEQVLAHGTPATLSEEVGDFTGQVPVVQAPDGHGLAPLLDEVIHHPESVPSTGSDHRTAD